MAEIGLAVAGTGSKWGGCRAAGGSDSRAGEKEWAADAAGSDHYPALRSRCHGGYKVERCGGRQENLVGGAEYVSSPDRACELDPGCERNGAVGDKTVSALVKLQPVRKVLVYILPHSHHDLGYTDLQSKIEEKQMHNITLGIDLARKTASYPEGSRFVWNLEVLWGADQLMRANPRRRRMSSSTP